MKVRDFKKGTPQFEAIEKIMREGRLASVLNESNAPKQISIALTAQNVVNSVRGHNAIPSLADTIVHQQHNKVCQYGDKAYKMSEKQVDVITRDFWL